MTVPGRNGGPRNDGAPGIRTGSVAGATVAGARYRSRKGPATWRGVIVILVLAALVIAGIAYLLAPAFRNFAGGMARSNPQTLRLPFVGDVVRDQLGTALTQPAGTDDTPVLFDVQPGSSVAQVADGLTSAGLIQEPLVFQYLVVTQNLDGRLQTGSFTLNKTMTPQQVVDRLQRSPDPAPSKTTIALRFGLRIEQIVAELQTLPVQMDEQEFDQLALHPPASILADYPWLKSLPRGRSLEGFLAGGVYEVDPAITPDAFLRLLLDSWAKQMGGQRLVDQATRQGKNFYDVMRLASIVERETPVAGDKVKIAGVYTNRLNKALNRSGLLNAEPTVIYANDSMQLRDLPFAGWQKFAFWGLTGLADLNKLEVAPDLEGYQSWHTPGLPPTPIDSPSLSSITAAMNPDTKGGFLYFYACATTKVTQFAKTIAQQQQNIAACK
jgi:UPF0755 protein